VDNDELMTIGRFAQLSGLSIGTLRHYDEVGLLAPAEVDPQSGYRRYRRGQLRRTWLIRVLRWLDLPIEEIRQVIDDETATAEVLARHRRRLERKQSLLTAQIGDTTRFIEKGITVPPIPSGCRVGQIKIAVTDMNAAVRFYQAAFGLRQTVIRRTENAEYSAFVFGEYGRDDFFLLVPVDDDGRLDLPGPSTFGLTVDDLDAYHARALAAGAAETVQPHQPDGMPRCSAVRDPSGNWIWLYQA
jgi:DNA-binding transcriptional MerR regulator